MEHCDKRGPFMPICPFLMPYGIRTENKMREYTVDALRRALKAIKNRLRPKRESVVVHWYSSAGLEACLSL
jgi:hypothetical protein